MHSRNQIDVNADYKINENRSCIKCVLANVLQLKFSSLILELLFDVECSHQVLCLFTIRANSVTQQSRACSAPPNQLNDTFGNRHLALPIGGIYK